MDRGRGRQWRMENGEWRMENGEWRMENGEWRMEKWRMENGEFQLKKSCFAALFLVIQKILIVPRLPAERPPDRVLLEIQQFEPYW